MFYEKNEGKEGEEEKARTHRRKLLLLPLQPPQRNLLWKRFFRPSDEQSTLLPSLKWRGKAEEINQKRRKSARRVDVPLSVFVPSLRQHSTHPKQQHRQDKLQAFQPPSRACRDWSGRDLRCAACSERVKRKEKEGQRLRRDGKEGKTNRWGANLLVLTSPPGLFLSHSFSAFSSRLDLQGKQRKRTCPIRTRRTSTRRSVPLEARAHLISSLTLFFLSENRLPRRVTAE